MFCVDGMMGTKTERSGSSHKRKGLGKPGFFSLEYRSEGIEYRPTPVWDRGHCKWVDIMFQDAAVLNGVRTWAGLRRCHHADSRGQNMVSERENQDTQGSRVSQGCGRNHPKVISPHQVRLGKKCPFWPSHVDPKKVSGGSSSV